MRMIYAMMLAAPMALISLTPAMAEEGHGQPFITADFYKVNITLDQFQVNPRSFFRSEVAFDLIVDYVGDEIGQPLTGSQFVALMRDETQTRTRDCKVGEIINTGAYVAGQFGWFTRSCRSGEQIVQVKLSDRWIDLLSLNCLNAVEDQTPAVPPQLTQTRDTAPKPRALRDYSADNPTVSTGVATYNPQPPATVLVIGTGQVATGCTDGCTDGCGHN